MEEGWGGLSVLPILGNWVLWVADTGTGEMVGSSRKGSCGGEVEWEQVGSRIVKEGLLRSQEANIYRG